MWRTRHSERTMLKKGLICQVWEVWQREWEVSAEECGFRRFRHETKLLLWVAMYPIMGCSSRPMPVKSLAAKHIDGKYHCAKSGSRRWLDCCSEGPLGYAIGLIDAVSKTDGVFVGCWSLSPCRSARSKKGSKSKFVIRWAGTFCDWKLIICASNCFFRNMYCMCFLLCLCFHWVRTRIKAPHSQIIFFFVVAFVLFDSTAVLGSSGDKAPTLQCGWDKIFGTSSDDRVFCALLQQLLLSSKPSISSESFVCVLRRRTASKHSTASSSSGLSCLLMF